MSPASARATAAETSTAAGESPASAAPSAESASASRDPATASSAAEHRKNNDDEGNHRRAAGDQQRPGDEPDHRSGQTGADGGAADVAEYRAQNRSDDRHRNEQDDEQIAEVERVSRRAPPGRFCGQRRSGADDFDDPIDAGIDALRELTLLEIGRDGFADDSSRGHVGEHALETVGYFDAHAPVVFGDEEDRAVILPFLADLPRLGDA